MNLPPLRNRPRAGSCSFVEALELRRLLAAGDVDLSFNSGLTHADFDGLNDNLHAVLVQPDGKVILGGKTQDDETPDNDYALARFNVDGTPDSSFGDGGLVRTDFLINESVRDMVLLPNGQIIGAGGDDHGFALVRWNADGSLDTSFGVGGRATASFAFTAFNGSVALTPQGKIITVGGMIYPNGLDRDFAVARFNADGTLDTSFGQGGKVVLPSGAVAEQFNGVALQPDGRILAVGAAGNSLVVVRLNSDGTADPTFGPSGRMTVGPLAAGSESGSIAVQPDGSFVVAGMSNAAVTRYVATGGLDLSFGNNGSVPVSIADLTNGQEVLLMPDGRVIIAGQPVGTFEWFGGAAVLTSSGQLEASFGVGGIARGYVSDRPRVASEAALGPDGSIILAGNGVTTPGHLDFGATRLIGPTPRLGAFAGGNYFVNENQSITLNGLAQPLPGQSQDSLIHEWDLDYNGQSFQVDATGPQHAFFAVDGPAIRKIGFRVRDGTGISDVSTAWIHINGAGPTISLIRPPALFVDTPIVLGVDASDSAPDEAAGFTYSWILRDAQNNVLLTGSEPAFTFTPTVSARYSIQVSVTDRDGNGSGNVYQLDVAPSTLTLTELNVTPTQVDESKSVTVSGRFENAQGMSGHKVVIRWGDGMESELDAPATGLLSVSHTYADDPEGDTNEYAIEVSVIAPTNEVAGGELTVTVGNASPKAKVVGPPITVPGIAADVVVSATDPSLTDTHAGFEYRISWGDGTETVVPRNPGNAGGVQRSHGYAAAGRYLVTVVAVDKDGAASAPATHSIDVRAAALLSDPVDSGKLSLFVVGTPGNDLILIDARKSGVAVTTGTVREAIFKPTGRIIVFGGEGNDFIHLGSKITLSSVVFGEGGNDGFNGGGGSNILVGGAGKDRLLGGKRRDVLIGGPGDDQLNGGKQDDLLVPGGTIHDESILALSAIAAEWSRTDVPFAGRVGHLKAGGGLNGSFKLDRASVVQGSAKDLVVGASSSDWVVFAAPKKRKH